MPGRGVVVAGVALGGGALAAAYLLTRKAPLQISYSGSLKAFTYTLGDSIQLLVTGGTPGARVEVNATFNIGSVGNDTIGSGVFADDGSFSVTYESTVEATVYFVAVDLDSGAESNWLQANQVPEGSG